jgi:malate synthase
VADLRPAQRGTARERETLQKQIDAWHRAHPGADYDRAAYRAFLEEIGYLLPEPTPFTISTENVDPEVASSPVPQLVVPVMNARYALNAANARWGSLYDALYGTDAIPEDGGAERAGAYNPVRGARVIAWARDFLDRYFPLAGGSHAQCTRLCHRRGTLAVALAAGKTRPCRPAQLRGYRGDAASPTAVLLATTACTSRSRSTAATRSAPRTGRGQGPAAGIRGEHDPGLRGLGRRRGRRGQGAGLRNWLGLMKGDLSESFDKGGQR